MMALMMALVVAMPGHMGLGKAPDSPAQASQQQLEGVGNAQEPAPQVEQDASDKAAQ